MQLKTTDEVQAHAEQTGHTNFEESTEAVLNLVCKGCGKPCRSETEKQMHTQRNPGHDEFVDKTNQATAISYAGTAAAGHGGGGDAAMTDADAPKERVSDKVNKELMDQLKDMGFPEVRAEKGLWLTGNSNLEAAVTWLADHSEDADIDEPLMVAPEKPKSNLTPEEQKKALEEKLAKMRAEKAKADKEMEKLQEINRIASMKEMTEARKKQAEQEEKIREEKRRREKEQDAKEKARVRAELAKDKAERLARAGVKPEEAAAAKPQDPHKNRKIELGTKLRDVIFDLKNDPAQPNPATVVMETAGKYVENIAKNPTEEKFRSINIENAAFQRRVASKKGGLALMKALGFEEEDGKLVLKEVDEQWLALAKAEIETATKRMTFY
eukprot:CAMPEP_0114124242 /NCGR_PEP_ID=MMETSP0043_2-20121206/8677_1 /TAXON_ID=464988 /ORGANISM="Hemiselmis andersenii, Strain CCMP644" /LENGTH=382 /DNA_ID=CAMNT_0001217117 /DNA_START=162 /DNA_END=1310 /DNA_ORIENTATION=+